MSILAALQHAASNHLPASTAGAAVTSAITTAGVMTQTIPLPEGTPTWLAALVTVMGPTLTLVASRLLAARAAKKRTMAARKREIGLAKKADGDPGNDAEAERLLDEAAAEMAEADALEALKPQK